MKPIILFRSDLDSEDEMSVAMQHMALTPSRTQVPPNSLVVGRYSVLPWYQELERDLAVNKSKLINTYAEHSWIADVLAWASPGSTLDGLTPPACSTWGNLPEGSYVLKGRTNSRKQQWRSHMFAATTSDIPIVAGRLFDDTMIKEQGLVVRPYVPLRKLDEGLNGLPIANEFRCFFLVRPSNGPECLEVILLGRGFYWASHPECMSDSEWTEEAERLMWEAAHRVAKHATFFVLDLAQAADGHWLVIEVNDAQMSGISTIDAHEFYSKLSHEI